MCFITSSMRVPLSRCISCSKSISLLPLCCFAVRLVVHCRIYQISNFDSMQKSESFFFFYEYIHVHVSIYSVHCLPKSERKTTQFISCSIFSILLSLFSPIEFSLFTFRYECQSDTNKFI